MKKITFISLSIVLLFAAKTQAQCTGQSFYDITVSGTTVYHPTSASYISAVVCSGGVFLDSASCCTRFVHILAGGYYEAGGMAYGMAFVQSGGTFNANNSTAWFGVTYEPGATILNYGGPMNLCSSITFSPSFCTSIINDIKNANSEISIHSNPASSFITISNIRANFTLNISDMLGKLMVSSEIKKEKSETNIDVSQLPCGIYVYSLFDENGNATRGKFAITQ